MIEYALMLFAVLLVAAAAVKTIGPQVKTAGESAASALAGESAGGGDFTGGGGGGGAGGGGARGFD